MPLKLSLNVGDGKNRKIDVDPFFDNLVMIFPDNPFEIYTDDGKNIDFYPDYKIWTSYKKGEYLGEQVRKKKISRSKALKQIKKWEKLPMRSHKDLYEKFLLITAYDEGYGTGNNDIWAQNSWKRVRDSIDFYFEVSIEELSK